jgi:glycosyltransferase involved in cell wall biosynthesis
MKVLFFLRRIGPYHHARFQAATSYLQLITVETRPGSEEYPWTFHPDGKYKATKFPISGDREKGVRRSTLFSLTSELIRQHMPTVIVTTGWADPEYHAVALEARKRRIPIIVISDSRYEDEQRNWYKEFIKKLILKSYAAALVAGESSRNYLVKLGFNSKAIFQPWDVVDNHYWAKIKAAAYQDLEFLCISRFIPKKNLFRLLNAYADYLKEGGRRKLTIVGDGELSGAVQDYVRRQGMAKFVTLPGFKQYEELPAYMEKGFCLILPSITDQWGLVVNEAMAAGLPVLVSHNCGCAADLVKNGKNGFTFDPLNVEAITSKLLESDSIDQSRWQKMSDCSRQVIQTWDVNHFAKALYEAASYAQKSRQGLGFKFLHQWLSR